MKRSCEFTAPELLGRVSREGMLWQPAPGVRKRWVVPVGVHSEESRGLPNGRQKGQKAGRGRLPCCVMALLKNANGVWLARKLSDHQMSYTCQSAWFQFTVWIRLKFFTLRSYSRPLSTLPQTGKIREGRNLKLFWLPTSTLGEYRLPFLSCSCPGGLLEITPYLSFLCAHGQVT